jgi:hypothetical protein
MTNLYDVYPWAVPTLVYPIPYSVCKEIRDFAFENCNRGAWINQSILEIQYDTRGQRVVQRLYYFFENETDAVHFKLKYG